MLFEPSSEFSGLPEAAFEVFAIEDREARRRAIVEALHPALEQLGRDLLARLNPRASRPLHYQLPRLDWPPGYQPFCTWLALSSEAHGYQAGAQLNVGVHADHVALRLGWDTAADAFGRFEFLCRHGPLGGTLIDVAAAHDLRFRVYAAAPWPLGSERVFETRQEIGRTFDEVRRRGVWWELGRRHDLPAARSHVTSAELGREVVALFRELLPALEQIAGAGGASDP